MTNLQARLDSRNACFRKTALERGHRIDLRDPSAAWPTAQEAPDAGQKARSSAAVSETLDTVTVTARKKAERLQDVPLAVTAITGQTLQDTNATSVRDIVTSRRA